MACGSGVRGVMGGHLLLALCALLYLGWWVLFFRPGATVRGGWYAFGVFLLLGAVVAGLGGVAVAARGLATLPAASVPAWPFALGAAVLYVVLLGVTRAVFARPVTTELLLIVAWCAFELYAAVGLACSGALPVPEAVALVLATFVLAVVSLVCYVLYYRLAPLPSFIDGAVPLVAVGIEAAAIAVLLR